MTRASRHARQSSRTTATIRKPLGVIISQSKKKILRNTTTKLSRVLLCRFRPHACHLRRHQCSMELTPTTPTTTRTEYDPPVWHNNRIVGKPVGTPTTATTCFEPPIRAVPPPPPSKASFVFLFSGFLTPQTHHPSTKPKIDTSRMVRSHSTVLHKASTKHQDHHYYITDIHMFT